MLSFSTTAFIASFALLQTSVSAASLRSLKVMDYQAIMSRPSPNCIIESGYDYVGNDISNSLGPVESCCDKCSSESACQAWSWTNQNGGTCWLKSKQGEIRVSPNVKSARLNYGYMAYCQLEQDVDIVGSDIGNKPSGNADGCCSLCQNTVGCRAYTWSDLNGGTCWLKSKYSPKIYKIGTKSAVAYPRENGVCPIPVSGVDFVGNDVGNKYSATPEGCCDICLQFPNCRSYSWTNQNGGTCWLKSAKSRVVAKAGVTSAQVSDNLPPSCSIEEHDVDYVGNDVGNTKADGWGLCCFLCAGNSACKAWTWSDLNGGTCWFKSGKGQTASKLGVTSAVLK